MFQILSTEYLIRVTSALSVKKVVLWRDSLVQEFRNSVNCFALMPKDPIWRFHRVWLSILRQIYIHYDENQTPSHIMVFGVVTNDGDVIPPFVFPHGFRVKTEAFMKSLEEVVQPWIESATVERSYLWQQVSEPTTQMWKPSIGCEKMSATTSALTPQIAIKLVINVWVRLSESPSPTKTKKKKKKRKKKKHSTPPTQ